MYNADQGQEESRNIESGEISDLKAESNAAQKNFQMKKYKKQEIINNKIYHAITYLSRVFQTSTSFEHFQKPITKIRFNKQLSEPQTKIQIQKQRSLILDVLKKLAQIPAQSQCFMCSPEIQNPSSVFIQVDLISLTTIKKQLLRYVSALINSGSGTIVFMKKVDHLNQINKRNYIEEIKDYLNFLLHNRYYKFRHEIDDWSEKQAIKVYVEADDMAQFRPAIFHKNGIGQYYIIDSDNKLASIDPENIYQFAYKFLLNKKSIICQNYKHKYFPDRRHLARSIKSTPIRDQIFCDVQLTNTIIWIKNAVQNQHAITAQVKSIPYKKLMVIFEEIVNPMSRVYFLSFHWPFEWARLKLSNSKQLGYSMINVQKNLSVKASKTEFKKFLKESASQLPTNTGVKQDKQKGATGDSQNQIVKLSFSRSSEAVLWYILLRQSQFKVFFGHKLYL